MEYASNRDLVLSVYPGIDLLGRGFEAEGFCVVRGPDLIWGQSIESFHIPSNVFQGIITGSPCQGFSKKNRKPDIEYSHWALVQFARVVTEGNPEWFLLENVPTVPDIKIEGYQIQRIDLKASECGLKQRRLRHFQFGSRTGLIISIDRNSANLAQPGPVTLQPCALASEGKRKDRRDFAAFCELQGLPRTFTLPGWPLAFKYSAVGNGVPIPMGRLFARAIVTARSQPSGAELPKLCKCNCGRVVTGRQVYALTACRMRIMRKRKLAGVLRPRSVTEEM